MKRTLIRTLLTASAAVATVASLTACASPTPWTLTDYPLANEKQAQLLPSATYTLDYTEHPESVGLSHGTGTLIYDAKKGCSFEVTMTTEMDPEAAGPDWALNPTIKSVKGFQRDAFYYNEDTDRWYSNTSGYTLPGITRNFLPYGDLAPYQYSSYCIVTALPAVVTKIETGDPSLSNLYTIDKKAATQLLHAAADALASEHVSALNDKGKHDVTGRTLAKKYYNESNPEWFYNLLIKIDKVDGSYKYSIVYPVDLGDGQYRVADYSATPSVVFTLTPQKEDVTADPVIYGVPDAARTFTGQDLSVQLLAQGKIG